MDFTLHPEGKGTVKEEEARRQSNALRQLTLCSRVRQRELRLACGFPPRNGCKRTEGKSSKMGITCPICCAENSGTWDWEGGTCDECGGHHYVCDDCGRRYAASDYQTCPECRRADLGQAALEAAQELEHDSSSDDSEADWEDLNVTDDEDEEEFQDRVDVRRVQNRRARRARHAAREEREAQRAEQEERDERERERKEAVKRKAYDKARIPPSKRPRSGGGDEGDGPPGCVVM